MKIKAQILKEIISEYDPTNIISVQTSNRKYTVTFLVDGHQYEVILWDPVGGLDSCDWRDWSKFEIKGIRHLCVNVKTRPFF